MLAPPRHPKPGFGPPTKNCSYPCDLACEHIYCTGTSSFQECAAPCKAPATCDVTRGYDFDGNDLLGPDGRPAPQNCSAGPGAYLNMTRGMLAAFREGRGRAEL